MNRDRWIIFLVVLFAVPGSGQTDSSSLREDFGRFLRLTTHSLTAPARWNDQDALIIGGVLGGTLLSSAFDEDVIAALDRNHSRTNDRLERVFEAYGSSLFGVGVTAVFYGSGWAFENEWLRETGVVLGSALTAAALTNTVIKYAIGRARPYTGLGSATFRPFNFTDRFVSFPSGHTTVAFSISSVLARRIDNLYASVALYAAAALTGTSRMYSRNHWLSDVVFAGAVASLTAHSIVNWFERGTDASHCGSGLRVFPHANGVTVVWRF